MLMQIIGLYHSAHFHMLLLLVANLQALALQIQLLFNKEILLRLLHDEVFCILYLPHLYGGTLEPIQANFMLRRGTPCADVPYFWTS